MSGIKLTNRQIFLRLSLLALFIASALTTLAVAWKRAAIETSLAQQARKALAEADLPVVNVHFEGRDGMLSGLLPNESALAAIIGVVGDVYGVRSVQNKLTIVPNDSTLTADAALVNGLYTPQKQHPLEQLDLSGIQFVYAQAMLTPSAYPPLDKLAAMLQETPDTRIEVAVHTDNKGTTLGQIASTQARAEAVLQYLLGKGISLERMAAKGYGATRPIASNDNETGQAENRRVEITVIKE